MEIMETGAIFMTVQTPLPLAMNTKDGDFFKALGARMPKKEKEAIRTMLEAMIVKNQVAGVLEGVAKAGSR